VRVTHVSGLTVDVSSSIATRLLTTKSQHPSDVHMFSMSGTLTDCLEPLLHL
jgi:hypothetical protein